MRRPQATVIGDSDASLEACKTAEMIGELLAKYGIAVITGGRTGIMEYACKGARKAGGLTIGILPSDNVNDANDWCTVVIPTGFGHARNVLTVLAGDFVVALGGAAGTLSEICFAWIYNKPILTLKGFEGWSERLGGTKLDHRRSEAIIVCKDLNELGKEILVICKKLNFCID